MAGSETVTVLFTDVVGSTALSTSLPVESADELRRGHFSLLRRAVAASGGTEVKNLGDGVMVVFSAASSALACAVAMQQGVETHNRHDCQSLGLRVGLSAGETTREGEDYFGDPVIEAARLCARAEGGQILISDIVRGNAGRRSPHPLSLVGQLELKGLPDPIETYEVSWSPLTEVDDRSSGCTVPLPQRLDYRSRTGVVGRTLELAVLEAAYKRVADGEGREAIWIAGEAGQGKTTLAAEAARRAICAGAVVLLGRCDEDLGTSYLPFGEALGHYVAHGPEEVLTSHVEAHGAELSRIVPVLRQRLGTLPPLKTGEPDTERYYLYRAVVGLLEAACATQPVVILLDDIQWADTASVELLRHLVKHTEGARLLILGTYRDAELTNSHPLVQTLGALRREQRVSRIDLKGLEDHDVVAFFEASAGHELSEAGVGLAHAVYRETDGNPFFVAEVVRHLGESGAVVLDEQGRWVTNGDFDETALPNSVREVVSARVSRVGDKATRVLSLAAVIGRNFDVDLLAQVTDIDPDELLDLLDTAAAAALVREVHSVPGLYTFSHALIQHTLYQDLGSTRRARAHGWVAEALEELLGEHSDARVGELAHHFVCATTPARPDKAVAYSRRAGQQALEALAPDDAVSYFAQALDLARHSLGTDPELRLDLLLELGVAQRQAGIPDFRETLLEAAHGAQQVGDANRLVRAALANNRGFTSSLGQVDTDRVAVLEAALHAVAADDGKERALLLATLCSELAYGSLDRRLELAGEAKAMARRLGDVATLIDVLDLCNLPLQVMAFHDQCRDDSTEALALAESLGDPVAQYWASNRAYVDAIQAGQFDRAGRCLETIRRLSGLLHQPAMAWMTAQREGAQALLEGDPQLGDALITSALEMGIGSGQPDALAYYGAQLIVVRFQQGRMGELVELLTSVSEQNPQVPSYLAGLAAAHLGAGNEAEARRIFDEAARGGFSLPPDTAWFPGIAFYCRLAIEFESPSAAEQLVGLLAPYHQQVPFSGTGLMPFEPVAYFLGGLSMVLGSYEEADGYFEEAAELAERGAMQFAQAQIHLLWGKMLLIRGESSHAERARKLLVEAHEAALAHGYGGVARQAEASWQQLV